jgi:hypothetical protein
MTTTTIEAPTITPDKPVELDEAGKVLMRAADIVRERWQQLYAGTSGEPRCALGAIYEASGLDGTHIPWSEDPHCCEAHMRLRGAVGAIHVWNDVVGRTAEEVAEALERAAYLG